MWIEDDSDRYDDDRPTRAECDADEAPTLICPECEGEVDGRYQCCCCGADLYLAFEKVD